MRKFPDINQYRHAVETVIAKATYVGRAADDTPLYDPSLPKPTLQFTGTVKLHGTNGGVCIHLATNVIDALSKERVLTLEQDNHGFCAWTRSTSGAAAIAQLRAAMERVWTKPGAASFHIFGEWCGPTVNSKTAVGQISDRWFAIAAMVTDEAGVEHWLDLVDVSKAFREDGAEVPQDLGFICDFKTWKIDIDFNDPAASLELLEKLTLEVETACPVATALGNPGLGEGIVLVCQDPKYGRIVFKTKGDKHKGTKGPLVNIAPEVLAGREAFVDAVLTESRLEQGFDVIKTRHGKVTLDTMGEFLQWIGIDVLKEESDTLAASGLSRKDVMPSLNRRAKAWATPRLAQF